MSLKNGAAVAILTACGLAAAGVGLHGQAGNDLDLVSITWLKCTFPVATRLSWKDGVPEPVIRTAGILTVEIKEIDVPAGFAIVGTASGSNDVNVVMDGRNLYFLEASRGGRLAVTTIFADHSTGVKLKATHSRTDYLPIDLPGFKSEPEVTQYYGDCEAKH